MAADSVQVEADLIRMDHRGLRRLEQLDQLNADPTWVNRDIYRLLFREDLLTAAYERIKSNPGNMTSGEDGVTLDGFSRETIRQTVEQLRNESFQFSAGRRVYIPKANGKMRPLTIAPPREKVVQEAIRMILTSIFDGQKNPTFLGCSHGFRANRGCHSALKEVSKWKNVAWFIEGDIKGCFDNVDHNTLVTLLRKRIADERFLNLIWKALKAGHFEFRQPVMSLSGTPQGSIVSPLLANIYLHELDTFVMGLKARNEVGTKRRMNPEYKRRSARAEYWRGVLRSTDEPDARERATKEIADNVKACREIPSFDVNDPNYIRIHYVRYADDWLMGVTGPKRLAEELREEIRVFLAKTLKLELSIDKTHIRHARTESAKFLGTNIRGEGGESHISVFRRNGIEYRARSTGWNLRMEAPVTALISRLSLKGFCDDKGGPRSMKAWLAYDDAEILNRYNSVIWGILNYYSFAHNFRRMQWVQSVLQRSAAKTLCVKHRIPSVRQAFRQGGASLRRTTTIDGRTVTASLRLNGNWRAQPARFLGGGEQGDIHAFWQRKYTRSRLDQPCALCGRTDGVEMHHVRHVRQTNQRLSGFTSLLASVNRKQVPVCKAHHDAIHKGVYDGKSLRDLSEGVAHWNWV